ncbi:alpha/beta hydrolase [Pseudoxanthomonas composti]|uniref:Alpha/beta hydrolase n=1 Tax=Pseudoxanthomonas composti TaxID=2137479 RepID=A0A4Q1JWU2_9GAMM|nr:alpha/beta hydrolase [Pseudoxanthomonas composti]RXR05997.1 alpha/beta hydrolase [Pseudoxanthomonas composti]
MSAAMDALDPQIRHFIDAVVSEGRALAAGRALDWPARRGIAEATRARWREGGPQMASTQDLRIDESLRLRVYRPHGAGPASPALVYVHGGGWCMFSLDTHDRLMREYAQGAGVVVVGVDYALSPEHPYPTALNQCVCAVQWLRDQAGTLGIDPQRMALAGDSAGGNLSVATALALRERGMLPGLRALVLNYGAWDPAISAQAAATLGTDEDMLSAAEMDAFWLAYLGPDALRCRDPLAVPVHADLTGLPPSLLLWGDRDVLAEQNRDMAQRLRAAGVSVETCEHAGAPHSFIEAMAVSDQARAAIARGCRWLRRHLFDPATQDPSA